MTPAPKMAAGGDAILTGSRGMHPMPNAVGRQRIGWRRRVATRLGGKKMAILKAMAAGSAKQYHQVREVGLQRKCEQGVLGLEGIDREYVRKEDVVPGEEGLFLEERRA